MFFLFFWVKYVVVPPSYERSHKSTCDWHVMSPRTRLSRLPIGEVVKRTKVIWVAPPAPRCHYNTPCQLQPTELVGFFLDTACLPFTICLKTHKNSFELSIAEAARLTCRRRAMDV